MDKYCVTNGCLYFERVARFHLPWFFYSMRYLFRFDSATCLVFLLEVLFPQEERALATGGLSAWTDIPGEFDPDLYSGSFLGME